MTPSMASLRRIDKAFSTQSKPQHRGLFHIALDAPFVVFFTLEISLCLAIHNKIAFVQKDKAPTSEAKVHRKLRIISGDFAGRCSATHTCILTAVQSLLHAEEISGHLAYFTLKTLYTFRSIPDHKCSSASLAISSLLSMIQTGKRLLSGRGDTTRPMMEKVRAAAFNMLQSRCGDMLRLPGESMWLDLFAGNAFKQSQG